MVYNTENETSLPEITREITNFRKNIVNIIVGNWEKRKQNTK